MNRGVLDPKEPDSLKGDPRDPIANAGTAGHPGGPKAPETPESLLHHSGRRRWEWQDALTYHEATLRQTLEETGL